MQAGAAERSKLLEKAGAALGRGELDTALKLYTKVFDDDPHDWNVGNSLGDLYVRMGRTDDAVSHFTMLAEQLAADGFTARARALYRKILRLQPNDEAARLRVDELDRQQVGSASPFLKRVLETARAIRESSAPPPALEETPGLEAPRARVAPEAPRAPRAAGAPEDALTFARADAAASEALAKGDYGAAATHLEEFIALEPHHVPALERLVGICVDGQLHAGLVAAQERLAEACVRGRQYRQALDIALDLHAREPKVAAHRVRVERIAGAARESGIDLVVPQLQPVFEELELSVDDLPAPASVPRPAAPRPAPVAKPVEPIVEPAKPRAPVVEPPKPAAPMRETPVPLPNAPAAGASVAIGPPFGDLLTSWSDPARALEDIQQALLEDAAAQAEEHFAQASRAIAARQLREAIAPLEEAMCLPHLRATAGARLARVYRDIGEPVDALETLEWAAELPPADEQSGHELAYELALTLEALGQESQALGVYRELLAEVGPSYRDIATRAQKLTAA